MTQPIQLGPRAPAAQAPARAPSGGGTAVTWSVVAVLAVLLVAGGFGVVRPDLLGLGAASPFATASGEAAPGGGATGSESVPSEVASTSEAAGTEAQDPTVALRREADADGADVEATVGSWVPQLSSKRPGTVDGGRTYDATAVLAEHQRLRARYPQARLLYSGDWPVFRAGDYWVTVLADPSSTPAGANAWCDTAGLGPDDCFAKQLAHRGGSEGTAVHR